MHLTTVFFCQNAHEAVPIVGSKRLARNTDGVFLTLEISPEEGYS